MDAGKTPLQANAPRTGRERPASTLALDSRQWHERLAALIADLHTETLPARLLETIYGVVAIDSTVVVIYRPNAAPIYLFDDHQPKRHGINVDQYLAGTYLLDPVYHAFMRGAPSGVYPFKEMAPDEFTQSEYYRTHYVRTGLIDEVCYFVALDDGAMLVLSHGRAANSGPFTVEDISRLRRIEPVVRATAISYWTALGKARLLQGEAASVNQKVRHTLEHFASDVLTKRERQLVMLMLRGHSTKSIAAVMNIAPGTARIHRQNLYAKLAVSSQAELFSLFISTLQH